MCNKFRNDLLIFRLQILIGTYLLIMSVMFSSENGLFISHESFLNDVYKNCSNVEVKVKNSLFKIEKKINKASTSRKKSHGAETEFWSLKLEVLHVKSLFEIFSRQLDENKVFTCDCGNGERNSEALEMANQIYKLTENVPKDLNGGNTDYCIITSLGGCRYIFPEHCRFFSRDVKNIAQYITDKYDLILLDPPWWNKYIRRKRKQSNDGYDMMYNDHIKNIPVSTLLKDDGLVVVWCTNSPQNIDALLNSIFTEWSVTFVAKWYWVKVTKSGQPICEFAEPPKKQPFEQLVFGCKHSRESLKPLKEKIIVSIPSALHSHKPPLCEVLRPYLPENPQCLELFARYLLPGWTSYGLEVLKFQHECLYDITEKKS